MKISFATLKNKYVFSLDNKAVGNIDDMLIKDEKVFAFKIRMKNSFKIPSCGYVRTEDIESVNNHLLIARSIHSSIDNLPFLKAQEIFLKEVINEMGF